MTDNCTLCHAQFIMDNPAYTGLDEWLNVYGEIDQKVLNWYPLPVLTQFFTEYPVICENCCYDLDNTACRIFIHKSGYVPIPDNELNHDEWYLTLIINRSI